MCCDTIVALGNSTKDGSVLFGKNSDREPNEAQNLVYLPRKKYSDKDKVKCTYITIPQVEETYAVLLSQPFWMWGCEMGSNEFGVTIGNEAVWSKEPYRKTGLLGMDLIRLALERSKDAEEALKVIINLLEKYGQGGACGYTDKGLFYHNSFIIADPTEAWVLETADKYWIAEKVVDVRSISNTLTIGEKYDLIHPELIDHAIDEGYCNSKEDFHFAECFIPRFNIQQIGAKGKKRRECTTNRLLLYKGKLTPQLIMTILRDHNAKPSEIENWDPTKGSMKSPCLHYKSFITPSQSTASLISHLEENFQIHWVSGTSAPCTSLYKPIFFPEPDLSTYGSLAGSQYNPKSTWWQHEKLHRLVLLDYQKRLNEYIHERNELEADFSKEVNQLKLEIKSSPNEDQIKAMSDLSKESFEISRKKTDQWIKKIQNLPIENSPGFFYRRRWKKINSYDDLPIEGF
ncbi:MAG: Dipeptidase [Promethearchaeota archaeon]|nr:MAG: Dipeptidase [Candidatus Lokiarchaeota archaeon]